MTTLTWMIRPAAGDPAFRVTTRLPAIRGLVVLCISALMAAGFVFDVASGPQPQPETQLVQQAIQLS